MQIKSPAKRIAAVVVTVAALTALTGSAQAASSKPVRMTNAEYRALVLRSEGLNERYRLGKWAGLPEGMTAPAYRALVLRSEALNKQYGLGRWSAEAAARTPAVSESGFAWGAFGIGAAAALGLALVAAGGLVRSRSAREVPRARTI